MAEYYDRIYQKTQQQLADLLETTPSNTFITSVVQNGDGNDQIVRVSVDIIASLIRGGMDSSETINVYTEDGSIISTTASEVANGISTNLASSLGNAELFKYFAKSDLNDKVNSSEIMSNISARCESLAPYAYDIVQFATSSPDVKSAISGVLSQAVQPDEAGVFPTDSYTGANAFVGAIEQIVSDVTSFFKNISFNILKVNEFLSQLGEAIANLLTWILKKLFPDLTLDYTINEKSKSLAVDIPFLSGFASNTTNFVNKLLEGPSGSQYDSLGFYFYAMGFSTNGSQLVILPIDNSGIKSKLIQSIDEALSETGFYETMIGSYVMQLSKASDGSIHFAVYLTGYNFTNPKFNEDGELQSGGSYWTTSISQENTTNEEIFNFLIKNSTSLVEVSDGTYPIIGVYGTSGVVSYQRLSRMVDIKATGSTPADLVNAIKFKNINLDTFDVASLGSDDKGILLNLWPLMWSCFLSRFPKQSESSDYDAILRRMTIPTTSVPGWDAEYFTPSTSTDPSVAEIFIPYNTTSYLDTWIHPQTDEERANEVVDVIMKVLVAAAAVVVTVGVMKARKKVRRRLALSQADTTAKYQAMVQNPTSANAQAYLTSLKRQNRQAKFCKLFGISTPVQECFSPYDSSTSIEAIVELIKG